MRRRDKKKSAGAALKIEKIDSDKRKEKIDKGYMQKKVIKRLLEKSGQVLMTTD